MVASSLFPAPDMFVPHSVVVQKSSKTMVWSVDLQITNENGIDRVADLIVLLLPGVGCGFFII